MSQLSFSSFDASLMVRDAQGRYLLATTDQILQAARQAIEHKLQRGASFTSPATVKEYLCAKQAGFEHEVFAVLFLDSQLCLIEYAEMFRGTISSASVHPREVVKEALRANAAAVILSHNHPSGNPEPSAADQSMTQQLRAALKLVDVQVVDHVIVAGSRTTSFAERGLL
ncbi:DNA repair protein RadC [Comamonas sp. w2-DMI]|uniref:RadC family protein n=1 Tax=Comamonas sp. w2-DMI TaxID=3126391 RepID=UPI0032E3CAA6